MTAFPKKNILVHRLTYPLTVSSLFRRPPVVSPVFPPDWTVPVSRFSPLFNSTIFTFLSPRSPTPFLSFHFHSTSICKKQVCNSLPFFTIWLKFLSHYFFTFCSPVASLFLTISSSTVFVYFFFSCDVLFTVFQPRYFFTVFQPRYFFTVFQARYFFYCFSAALFFLLFFSRAVVSVLVPADTFLTPGAAALKQLWNNKETMISMRRLILIQD